MPRGLGRRRVRRDGSPARREPVGADPRDQVARVDAARHCAAGALPRRLAPRGRRHRGPVRRLRSRERDRGLPPPRPSERRLEPARGGGGDHGRRRRVPRGPRVQPGPHRRDGHARGGGAEAARARGRARPPERPDRCARPAPRTGARGADQGGERAPGRLLRPGLAGVGLASALAAVERGGRSHRDRGLPARADPPPRLRRVGGGVAAGPRPRDGPRRREAVGRRRRHRRVHRRRAGRARRAANRRARGRVRPPGRPRGGARRPSARACRGRSAARGARGGGAGPRPRPAGRRWRRRSGRSSPPRRCSTCSRRGATVRHRRVPRARPGRVRRHAGARRPDRRARGRAARAAGATRRRTR